MMRKVFLCLLACLVLQQVSLAAEKDPSIADYFWGKRLVMPVQEQEKVFYPKDNQANFTYFDGVEAVRVDNGVLHFTLSAEKAMLGWGNFLGKQPVNQVLGLWPGVNQVRLKVKQSGGKSNWQLRFWVDGKRASGGRGQAVEPVQSSLEGTEWTELALKSAGYQVPAPDGMEIEIEGEKGTRFEIADVKVVQPVNEGYCRKEVVLPAGKVWRAIADVGGVTATKTLYINGREVKRYGTKHSYHTSSLDIAPYLKPGGNCFGFYGRRIGYPPYVALQAKIIMDSGEVIALATDESWKYSPREEKGWNTPGFDDSAWTDVPATGHYPYYLNDRASDGTLSIPAYKGRLVIKNPAKNDLFYLEGNDLVFDVYLPQGMKQEARSVDYVFSKADAEGNSSPLKEGSVSSYTQKGSSLVYRINMGQHPGGVYTIALALKGPDGAIVEERPREPLMVLGRPSARQIEGKDYKEGLDLELEDAIDFTNPKDPHPWIEAKPGLRWDKPAIAITTPAIVRKKELVYRETADLRGAFFSYRFEFKHPGSFYLLEVEYPDDAERDTEVSISTKIERIWSNSQSGVGAKTGGQFYPTNKMQTLRWIHVADAGVHSVDVISQTNGLTAAAKSIKIYRIKGDLPSVGSGSQRDFGIHTERCYFSSGIGMNFGIDQPKPPSYRMTDAEKEKELSRSLLQRLIRDLIWMEETAEKYTQYLKFAGQNTFIMGCYQYSEGNTPFVAPYQWDTARLPHCFKSVLANVFQVNGISFYAGVEWSQFSFLSTSFNNAQVAQGADTIWMVNAKGEQCYGIGLSTIVPNWLHPKNKEAFGDLMRQLADKFDGISGFKGIHFFMGLAQRAPYYIPAFAQYPDYDDPFRYSYDDVTIAQFERDTKIRVPIDPKDPLRFNKRYIFLTSPTMKQKWIKWRCQKVQEFLTDGLAALKEEKKDVGFIGIPAIENPNFFKYWLSTGRPYKELLKDFAIDLDLLGKTKGLWIGRWTWTPGLSRDPYTWISRVDPRVTSAFDRMDNGYVLVRISWDENLSVAGGHAYSRGEEIKLVESDWIMNFNRVRVLPAASGYHSREGLLQALITGDPDYVCYGLTDLNINVGWEQQLREFAKVFTHLPKDKFQPVLDTGLTTNLAIRQLSRRDGSYFYVANPGYWHMEGTLTLRTNGKVSDLVTGRTVKVSEQGGRIIVPVSLDPYGLVAYRVSSPRLEIESYATSSISKAELAYLQGIIDRVADLLAKPEVKIILPLSDREFVQETLQQARQEIGKKEYASAWSHLTNYRFWSLWKDFLEKAAQAVALLPDSIKKENSQTGKGDLRTITALRTDRAITVDGKLEEPAWQGSPFSAGFVDKDGKPTMTEAGVKVLYDDRNIYFGFICADKDPTSLKVDAEEEQDIFFSNDDVIASFIQPDETAPVYYQLAFNTKGVQFDQKVMGAERDYVYHPDWQTAAFTADKYWTAEVAIPFAAFGLESAGDTNWRTNFHRIFRNRAVEPGSWSLTGREWHNPERFGRLKFEKR